MLLMILLNLLPTVAGIVLAFCYLPQIKKTIQTKNVEGMAVSFWVILSVALFLLTINALTIFITAGVWGYLLTEIFNLGLALTMLFLVLKYRKKK